jgi:hypothetical protein
MGMKWANFVQLSDEIFSTVLDVTEYIYLSLLSGKMG